MDSDELEQEEDLAGTAQSVIDSKERWYRDIMFSDSESSEEEDEEQEDDDDEEEEIIMKELSCMYIFENVSLVKKQRLWDSFYIETKTERCDVKVHFHCGIGEDQVFIFKHDDVIHPSVNKV